MACLEGDYSTWALITTLTFTYTVYAVEVDNEGNIYTISQLSIEGTPRNACYVYDKDGNLTYTGFEVYRPTRRQDVHITKSCQGKYIAVTVDKYYLPPANLLVFKDGSNVLADTSMPAGVEPLYTAMSPNGKYIAVGGDDDKIYLFEGVPPPGPPGAPQSRYWPWIALGSVLFGSTLIALGREKK